MRLFLSVFLVVLAAFPVASQAALVNGGFESGFDSWTVSGNAAVVTDASLSDGSGGSVNILPYAGEKMASLTGLLANDLLTNTIYQDVQLNVGDNFLSFAYNFWSYDEGVFDNPGFLVQVNGAEVFSLSAADIGDGSSGTLDYTGWTKAVIPVSDYISPDPTRPATIRVAFSAGNTGDGQLPSGVFLDEVQFNEVPIPSAILLLGSGMVGLVVVRRKKSKLK